MPVFLSRKYSAARAYADGTVLEGLPRHILMSAGRQWGAYGPFQKVGFGCDPLR